MCAQSNQPPTGNVQNLGEDAGGQVGRRVGYYDDPASPLNQTRSVPASAWEAICPPPTDGLSPTHPQRAEAISTHSDGGSVVDPFAIYADTWLPDFASDEDESEHWTPPPDSSTRRPDVGARSVAEDCPDEAGQPAHRIARRVGRSGSQPDPRSSQEVRAPRKHTRAGLRFLCVVAAVGLAAVAIHMLTASPGQTPPHALRVATTWLTLHDRGDDGQAAALWHTPSAYRQALPVQTVRFHTTDDVRAYWAGRPCHLKLIATRVLTRNVVTLRVLTDSRRYSGETCHLGATYIDRFTVASGHIVNVISLLTPVETAKQWLDAYDRGDDDQAASIWEAPGTVQTAYPSTMATFATAEAIRRWWAGRGCHMRLTAPITANGDAVTLWVHADRQRNSPTAVKCTSIGRSYQYILTISNGHISNLIARLA